VFDRHEDEWHLFEMTHIDVAFGLRGSRNPVCYEPAESIARDDEDGQVDFALEELLPKVDKIHGNQVASSGNLHLDANRNEPGAPIYGLALHPIHATALLLSPPSSSDESLVDHRSNSSGAVAVFLLLDVERKPGDDRPDLLEEFVETKAGNEVLGAVK